MMRLVAALLLWSAGCGGSVDLAGTYQVDHNEQGMCGRPLGSLTVGYYIVMEPVDVGFQAHCFNDAQFQNACFFPPNNTVFDHAGDGGWSGSSASTGRDSEGGACWVDYIESTAQRDGDRLTFDVHVYQQNATLTGIPCTVEEATRRGSTLQYCMEQRIEAARQ